MGSATIPSSRQRWTHWFDTPVPFDAIGGLAGTIGTVIAGARALQTPSEEYYAFGYFVGAAVVVAATIGKVRLAVKEHKKKVSLHDLAGCVHTLTAILLGGEKAAQSGLRATIHVAARKKGHLEQVVEYAGDNRSKAATAGREFPVNCGISGFVFRTKRPRVAYLEDGATHDQFIAEMMDVWGFDEEQARRLDPSTRAWGAWPIETDDGRVAGVLYLDSKRHDFFTEQRQGAIGAAVAGIAFFVGLRYARP